jgi:hypothetical protein
MTDTYTVTVQTTFRAMEGTGFNATLFRNGVKVAHVDDEGTGGMLRFEFFDRAKPRVQFERKNYKDEMISTAGTPEEALLAKYVLTIPPTKYGEGEDTLSYDEDLFVGELAYQAIALKKFRRIIKAKTLFVNPAKKGIYSLKGTDEATRAHVRMDVPNATILNDLPETDAFKIYLETQ